MKLALNTKKQSSIWYFKGSVRFSPVLGKRSNCLLSQNVSEGDRLFRSMAKHSSGDRHVWAPLWNIHFWRLCFTVLSWTQGGLGSKCRLRLAGSSQHRVVVSWALRCIPLSMGLLYKHHSLYRLMPNKIWRLPIQTTFLMKKPMSPHIEVKGWGSGDVQNSTDVVYADTFSLTEAWPWTSITSLVVSW